MRVLGLDVGEKTIGVAVSDGLGISAQGVLVIRRQSKEKDMAALLKIIEEYEAERIIIGLPKNMNGSLGPQAEKALEFAEMLEKTLRPASGSIRREAFDGAGPEGAYRRRGVESEEEDGHRHARGPGYLAGLAGQKGETPGP